MVTLKFAALWLPVAIIAAVRGRADAQQLATCGASGFFRVLFFLPYVVPFVAGVLIWQHDAQPGQRLART